MHRMADACAAGAVCLFGISLSAINLVVQIIAGSLAAIAGAVSLYGKWASWKRA